MANGIPWCKEFIHYLTKCLAIEIYLYGYNRRVIQVNELTKTSKELFSIVTLVVACHFNGTSWCYGRYVMMVTPSGTCSRLWG